MKKSLFIVLVSFLMGWSSLQAQSTFYHPSQIATLIKGNIGSYSDSDMAFEIKTMENDRYLVKTSSDLAMKVKFSFKTTKDTDYYVYEVLSGGMIDQGIGMKVNQIFSEEKLSILAKGTSNNKINIILLYVGNDTGVFYKIQKSNKNQEPQ